uniref:Reverse transcriptase domain-containing protein n=1 Tax=Tanacetum cinerariifolium TaxID=118510 RepID=A0A699GT14_TANCI|nr:hypothetical protein [Tanacetum cinerariifolium]
MDLPKAILYTNGCYFVSQNFKTRRTVFLQTKTKNHFSPGKDVKPKQIILDPDDQPIWESAKNVAPTPNSFIVQIDVDDNFVINEKLEALTIKIDSRIISLKEEMHEMRNKYQHLRDNHASKNNLNDDMPMVERHEENYIQYKGYQSRDSYDSFSHQSLHDRNDSEKSLTELNNNEKNDLDDLKRCADEEYERINKEMYDDVNMELKDRESANEEEGDKEMSHAENVNAEHEEVS